MAIWKRVDGAVGGGGWWWVVVRWVVRWAVGGAVVGAVRSAVGVVRWGFARGGGNGRYGSAVVRTRRKW